MGIGGAFQAHLSVRRWLTKSNKKRPQYKEFFFPHKPPKGQTFLVTERT